VKFEGEKVTYFVKLTCIWDFRFSTWIFRVNHFY